MPVQMPPGLIRTTKGQLPESALRRMDGAVDNSNEFTEWVEFYLGDELVHRSVNIQLKQMPPAGAEIGTF